MSINVTRNPCRRRREEWLIGDIILSRDVPQRSSSVSEGWVVGAPAQRPLKFSVVLGDGKIVDAGYAQPHETVLVESPVLIAIAAEPFAAVVVPLIGKTDRGSRGTPRSP
jgi:hypothetical protein